MMKKSSIKLAAATFVFLAIPATAPAQMAVIDAAANTQLATMNAQLKADAVYLQTGYNGNGLLPLLSSINDKLGRVNADNAQSVNNLDAAARKRLYDQGMIDMKKSASPTQEDFKRACVDISARLTSPQGHGAASGAADAFTGAREHAEERELYAKAPTTVNQKIAETAKDRAKKGFCSKLDISNGSPGCADQAEGDMPSADSRAATLTVAPKASPSTPSNGSLSDRQFAAAQAYILKTSALPPNVPSDAVLATEGGKRFLASLDRYASRGDAGGQALMNIAISHKAIPTTINGKAETSPTIINWRALKTEWALIFGPKIEFPQTPSERDMLRYEVFRFYSSPTYSKYIGTLEKDESGAVKGAQEMTKQQALTNRLLFQLIQRQEDNNVMLAQLLHQSLDPLTVTELNDVSKNIQSGK